MLWNSAKNDEERKGERWKQKSHSSSDKLTVLLLTPFWFLNEYYGLLYTKLHYIGPVESILEGLEILEVLSEELKLPGLKGLCLEPT